MATLTGLPFLSLDDFRREVAPFSPAPLAEASIQALYAHYLELSRWNRVVALVGPGTFREALSRHYGESLAALSLLPAGARTAIDLGSGAGFPGFVLAAAFPGLEMTLIEARGRKWSFLQAAVRRASLPCRCLNVRVSPPLPVEIPGRLDVVTARALKLDLPLLRDLASRLTSQGLLLIWAGEADPEMPPDLVPGAALSLPGSEHRRILSFRRAESIQGGS